MATSSDDSKDVKHLMLQVFWPQLLTLVVMIGNVVLTLKQSVPGNTFMAIILSSQIVMNITNATIVGGVYELASWLPPVYLQVCASLSSSPKVSSSFHHQNDTARLEFPQTTVYQGHLRQSEI